MAVSIVIGGDIVPSFQNLNGFCQGNIKQIVDDACLEVLNAADLRVYNLETPLSDSKNPIEKEGANFCVPEAAINGLQLLRPDALSLGNNHSKDQAEQGLLSTIGCLQKNGIVPFGYGKSYDDPNGIVYLKKNDLTVALLSCAETEFTVFGQGEYGALPYHDYWTNMRIGEAKKNSDLVIVLYHGGKEYYPYAAPYQTERCRLMVDCGADYVICQHSHCIGCCETYNGGTILYGQGNFIFRQRNNLKQTKEGLLVKIDIDSGEKKVEYIPVVMDDCDRTCLATGEEKERILAEFADRSCVIKDDRQVAEKYREFAQMKASGYHTRLLGSSQLIRFIARVYRKLGIRLFHKDASLRLQNLLQNEAHRELFLAYLKEATDCDKSNHS